MPDDPTSTTSPEGDQAQTREMDFESLSELRKSGDRRVEATAFSNTGRHYDELGDKQGEAVTTLNLVIVCLGLPNGIERAKPHMIAFMELYGQLDPQLSTALG